MISHTWVFIGAKLLTRAAVVLIVRWARNPSHHVILVAMAVSNVLVVTVTAASIVTRLG
jgi:hypothetical protein